MQQQPIPPQQPISVRLTARQWNAALAMMNEGLSAAAAVLNDIQAQCMAVNNATLDERAADG